MDSPATRRHLQFIENVQGTDKRMDTTSAYLKELNKMDLRELAWKKASSLIDGVEEGREMNVTSIDKRRVT